MSEEIIGRSITFKTTIQDGKSVIDTSMEGKFCLIEILGIIEMLKAAQIENYYNQYGPTKQEDKNTEP